MTISPRHRRLFADLVQMKELAAIRVEVSFAAEGDPPERYAVLLHARGLSRGPGGELTTRQVHRFTVYLHDEYPRRPPEITWLTPIVHPNILPPTRNGGVCIGSWSAGESLADLVRRLLDLVTYRSFNLDDPLDRDAAVVVRELGVLPGDDLQRIVAGAALLPEAELGIELTGRRNG